MDRLSHSEFEPRASDSSAFPRHLDVDDQFKRLALHDELVQLKEKSSSSADFVVSAVELLFATTDCERIDLAFVAPFGDFIEYASLQDPTLLANTEGKRIRIADSILRKVVTEGETIRFQGEDWMSLPKETPRALADLGVRTFLAVPIAAKDRIFGAIVPTSFANEEFSRIDLLLTKEVASMAAEVMWAERARDELLCSRLETKAVAAIESFASDGHLLEGVHERAAREVREMLGADACALLIRSGSNGSLAAWSSDEDRAGLVKDAKDALDCWNGVTFEIARQGAASGTLAVPMVLSRDDESGGGPSAPASADEDARRDALTLGFRSGLWTWCGPSEASLVAIFCGAQSKDFQPWHGEALGRFGRKLAALLQAREQAGHLQRQKIREELQATLLEFLKNPSPGVCQRIVEAAGKMLGLERCYVIRINEVARTIEISDQYHREPVEPVDITFSYDDGQILCDRLRAGEFVVTDFTDPRSAGESAEPAPAPAIVGSVTYSPVLIDGQLAGALVTEQYGKHERWMEQERSLLEVVAGCVALAMRTQDLRTRIGEQREVAGLLNRITSAIREALDLETLTRTMVSQLAESARLELCAILFVDAQQSRANTVAQHHSAPVLALPESYDLAEWGRLFRQLSAGESLLLDRTTTDPRSSMIFSTRFQPHGLHSVAVIPVLQRRTLTALILAGSSQASHVWHGDDLDLLKALADQMAISIGQAGMLCQLQAQADRAALLNRITHSIRRSLDTETVLQTTVEELALNFQLDRCFFYRVDEEEGLARVVHQYCAPDIRVGEVLQYRLEEWEPIRSVLEKGEIFASGDALADPSLAGMYERSLRPSGTRSILCVPVVADGKLAAIIEASHCRGVRHWSQEERTFFAAVAGQVSIAMTQSQLHQRIKSQARRETLLNHIVRESRSILDIDRAIRVVTGELRKALGVERCFYWQREEGGAFRPRGADALAGYEIDSEYQLALSNTQLLAQISENRETLAVTDAYLDPRCDAIRPVLEGLGIRSFVRSPVVASDGEMFGVLALHQCRAERSWTPEEVNLIQAVARELAVTLRIAQLYRASEEKKRELAGLYEISKTFSSVSHVRETYEQLTQLLAALTRAEICFLASYDPETGRVSAETPGFGIDADRLSSFVVSIDPDLAHRSKFHARQTYFSNDLSSDPTFDPSLVSALGIRSILVAPMKAQDRVAGFIFLLNRPEGFSAADADLLSIYATHAAEAVTSARLFHQTQQQIEYEELLNRITSSIRQSLDFEATCRTVVESLRQNLELSVCSIAKFGLGGEFSICTSPSSYEAAALAERIRPERFGEDVLEKLRAGDQVRLLSEPAESAPGDQAAYSLVVSPVQVERNLKGVLVASDEAGRQWTEYEASLLAAVCGQLAVAIIQSDLHREVQARADREALFNRISGAMSQSLDLPVLLQSTADEIGRAFGVDGCVIESLDGAGKSFSYGYRAPEADERALAAIEAPSPHAVSNEPGLLQVPVRLADLSLGVIRLIDLSRGKRWPDEDVECIRHLADHLSIVIHNAKLFAEAQHTARNLAVLNNINNAARRCVELSDVLEDAVREVGRAVGADTARILLCGANSAAAVLSNEYLRDGEPARRGEELPLQDISFVRRLLVEKTTEVLSPDSPEIQAAARSVLSGSATNCSVIATPLVSADESIGILSVSFRQPRHWTEQEIDLITAAADQIANIIRQMKLYLSLEESAKEAIALYKAIGALASSLSLDELLAEIVRVMTDVLGYRNCAILMLDEERRELYYKAARGYPAEILQMRPPVGGESILSKVARTQEMEYVPDAGYAEHFASGTPGAQSVLALPLVIDSELLGVMVVESEKAGAFHERDFTLLNSFAQKVALAIRQARLFEQVSLGKEQWEATFNAMKDSLFIYDRDGKLIRTNTAADRLLRAPRPHVWRTDDAPTSPAYDDAIVSQAIESRQTVSIERGYPPVNKPYHITVYPILDDTGSIVGAVKIARDLTELRRAEKRAKETEEFAAELVENGFDAIYILDPEGCFKWMNKQTSKIYGYSSADLLGTNFASLFVHEDLEAAVSAFQQALAGTAQVFEARVTPKSGQFRSMMFTTSPFRRNGKIVGALTIARDVTEQKEIQASSARSEKMRALGELASGVAHDFNNILAAILGRAQLLKSQVKDENIARSIDVIARAATDGSNTIKRIQNFARRRLERNFEVVALSSLVHDVIDITRTHWKDNAERAGKKIEMKTSLDDGVHVAVDPSELREVFINLIINAADAMPEGGEISITTTRILDEAIIEVRDTGQGMPEEIRNKIFDPFFTTKGAKGTGLGLSVSYGIISRHDGTIEVASQPGAGTCFTITLPAKDVDEQETIETVVESVKPARILCIDDEPTVRDVLAEILQGEGHTVELADSGILGLKMLSEGPFDLVFTDLGMPEMNGWEVAAHIKETFPGLPVIMSTGWGEEIDRAQAAREGVMHVVSKPFRIDEIFAVVAKCLNACESSVESEPASEDEIVEVEDEFPPMPSPDGSGLVA